MHRPTESSSEPDDRIDIRRAPPLHSAFLEAALPRLRADERIVAVAAGGSYRAGTMDEYSDLDLVIAVDPNAVSTIMSARQALAAELDNLLTAFTGEHVGEPRLLICLYGPPLLHVDLKFVSLTDAAERVEDPDILWEREGRLSAVLQTAEAAYPTPDLQWIEDRFWVWIHYGATKLGRGELFEVLDTLGFLRARVLGPLALLERDAHPDGVRKLEVEVEARLPDFVRTSASYDREACALALQASAILYRDLRERLAPEGLARRSAAESAVLAYLDRIVGG